MSVMTWDERLRLVSEVSIVRAGLSKLSGKATGPSLKVYLCPFFAVLSTFLAPLRYVHFAKASSER